MGNSAHARCQKGGVPEAEIYLQLIHFEKVSYYSQLRRGRREKISKKEKEKGQGRKKTEKRRARRARPTLYTQALTPSRPPQAEITGIRSLNATVLLGSQHATLSPHAPHGTLSLIHI